MIDLERHIEILLLDNDCVIVPDFGGFVAHHVAAHFSPDDQTFLPPMRTLGFNQQLRMNDSLLVQSYVMAYDISYPEALRRVEDAVSELRQHLETEGSYTMDNIGTLQVNNDGNYLFSPCEAGILSPEYYGLGGVETLLLKDMIRSDIQPEKAQVIEFTDHQATIPTGDDSEQEASSLNLLDFTDSDESDRAFVVKASWIRNTVAIAAAVLAFFLMTTPIANSDFSSATMHRLQSNILYKLMPQDTNMTPEPVATEVSVSQATAKDAKPAAVAAPEEAQAEEEPDMATPPYCIVLASQVKLSNAEYYVEQLHRQGYAEAEVYVHNKVVRVVYGAYATEAEAYRQLNHLRDNEQFEEAWVYRKSEV